MARSPMVQTDIPGAYAAAQKITPYSAFDSVNQMTAPCTGHELIIFSNTSGSSVTVTVHAVPGAEGRSVDLTQVIATTEVWILPKLRPQGWRQASGVVNLDATGAINYACLIEPAQIQ